MRTLDTLQAVQQRLAAHYETQRPNLLPNEEHAFLSMLGKMQIMAEFLALPPDLVAKLPASGEGSMAEARKMAKAMVADVDAYLVEKRLAMH
ncbi:hypothetical protein MASR1M60_10700 [Rhodocyclaceae bacterium]